MSVLFSKESPLLGTDIHTNTFAQTGARTDWQDSSQAGTDRDSHSTQTGRNRGHTESRAENSNPRSLFVQRHRGEGFWFLSWMWQGHILGDSEFITHVLPLLNSQRHQAVITMVFGVAFIYDFCTGRLLSFFDQWVYSFQQIQTFSNILYSSVYFVPPRPPPGTLTVQWSAYQSCVATFLVVCLFCSFLPLSLWVSFWTVPTQVH